MDIALGYVHLVALASDGSVYTCATGFDGYAGIVKHKTELTSGLGRKTNSTKKLLSSEKFHFTVQISLSKFLLVGAM